MSLEEIGSTAYARLRALKRIDHIVQAKSAQELAFRFGIAVGHINSAAELKALGVSDWSGLQAAAEHAYDNHPLVVVQSGDLEIE